MGMILSDSNRQEILKIKQQAEDARQLCIRENRNPTAAEYKWALGLSDRIDEIKREAKNMSNIQLLEYVARTIQAENRQPTDEERRIASEACAGLSEDQIPEFWTRSQSRPFMVDPGNGGSYRSSGGPFSNFGEQMAAIAVAMSPGGALDSRLPEFRASATGLQEGVDSSGGFLVQADFATELLRGAYGRSQVASRCRRIPIGANSNGLKINGIDETSRANGSRWGGILAYWEGEADKYTGTKPKFRQIELKLRKLTGLCYATDEMMADAVALGALLQSLFADEFAFRLDDACIWGTGVGMPLGFMEAAAKVQVSKVASQAAGTVIYDNVIDMFARLPANSVGTSAWYINQNVLPQLLKMSVPIMNMAGTDYVGGSAVYVPPGGASASPYGALMGRPVIPIEQCSTLGDAGDIILADMSQYLLIDKGQMETAASIHVRFEYGEQVFRFTLRCDGQPIPNAALTPYKGSSTICPFIYLEART